jgi:hypothetical protein
MLLKDVLMRSTLRRYIRVMVATQDVRSAVQRVVANPPTALGVAVDLADAGVHPDADRGDKSRLAQVGTEAGPEVVIEIRPAVKRSSVKCQPMSHGSEEPDEEGNTHHKNNEEEDKSQDPRLATALGCRADSSPVAASRLGQRS